MEKQLNQKKTVKLLITILSVAMCVFHLYTAGTFPLSAMEQRSLHFAFALALIFLWASLDEKKPWLRFLDYALALIGVIVNLYMYFNWLELSMRSTALLPMDYVSRLSYSFCFCVQSGPVSSGISNQYCLGRCHYTDWHLRYGIRTGRLFIPPTESDYARFPDCNGCLDYHSGSLLHYHWACRHLYHRFVLLD